MLLGSSAKYCEKPAFSNHDRENFLKLTINEWGKSEHFVSVLLGNKKGAVSSVEDGALLVVLDEVEGTLGVGCVP